MDRLEHWGIHEQDCAGEFRMRPATLEDFRRMFREHLYQGDIVKLRVTPIVQETPAARLLIPQTVQVRGGKPPRSFASCVGDPWTKIGVVQGMTSILLPR